ncbi:MAG TPA: hypothetical protein GXX20_01915 [Clostridiaceae bacterium]|nr:hypothetical protein [Clostridiaceae bacterium]
MSITVNLCSEKKGELKNFLEKYFNHEVSIDEDVNTWIYVYKKPLEAIDIISAVIDNNHKYSITVGIDMGNSIYMVSPENHDGVIKDFYNLFY